MADQEQPQARPQRSASGWKGLTTVLTIAGSLVSGGAMGALITHYFATRQTVVNYSVNTTSLGAGEATKSVLPTLRLQLDNLEIPVVYTHTIELSHASGPELDQATVSITLPGAKLYGSPVAFGPDPVHSVTCKVDQQTQALVCALGRITPGNNPYRVIVATDRAVQALLGIDGRNTSIQQSSHTPAANDTPWWILVVGLLGGTSAFGILFATRLVLRPDRRTRAAAEDNSQLRVLEAACRAHGLTDRATRYSILKEVTYYGEADRLGDEAIQSFNTQTVSEVKTLLTALSIYPDMHDRSRAIVLYNLARISKREGRITEMNAYLVQAKRLAKDEIAGRVRIDPLLKDTEGLDA